LCENVLGMKSLLPKVSFETFFTPENIQQDAIKRLLLLVDGSFNDAIASLDS
jgi:hypothetical protein